MTTARPRSGLDDEPGAGLLDSAEGAAVRSSLVRLAERFRPTAATELAATWIVEVTGHPAYTITVRDRRCLISVGEPQSEPDARLSTDAATWTGLVNGHLDGITAFLDGRLRIRGDLNLAVRLETLFTPGPDATRLVRTLHTRAKGVEIESLAAGTGRPVVLLHGLAANKVSFLPTFDALAHHHEVHALDLPGFGKSSKPLPRGRRYSPAWMADVVHAYLIRHQLRGAYVVGNSMGGRIATELALRHPGAVRGIVGLGPAVAFDEWSRLGPLFKLVNAQWVGLAPWPMPRHWLEQAMAEMLFHDPSALPYENFRAGAEDTLLNLRDRSYRLAVTACTKHLISEKSEGRGGFWSRLQSLQVPSYWIWGRSDRLVSHRYAHRVKEILPHAQVEVWDQVGHVPQFEVPERTNRSILKFVSRIEAGH